MLPSFHGRDTTTGTSTFEKQTNAILEFYFRFRFRPHLGQLPCFVHFYTVGQRYLDWVPYSWCFAYFCLTDYLPTVFHTASIWLTTSVAVQRYACVCCSVHSKVRQRLCSMRGAMGVIVAVFTSAIASQACRLGELTFSAVRVPSLIRSTLHADEDDNATAIVEVTACHYEHTPFVARHETIYYSIYYWSRVILIHVIPCSALVLLNAGLIRTMRAADERRRKMTRLTPTLVSNRLTDVATEMPASQYEMQVLVPPPPPRTVAPSPSSHRRGLASTGSDSSRRSTMMLVVVVGVFLLVEVPLSSTPKYCEKLRSTAGGSLVCRSPELEVPLSVLLLLVIIENTFDVDMFSDETRYTAAMFVNFSIAITFPLNFFVYCAMSERFRRMFCALFRRSANINNAQSLAPTAARRLVAIELD